MGRLALPCFRVSPSPGEWRQAHRCVAPSTGSRRGMFSKYLCAAMRGATFEIIEDGGSFYGRTSPLSVPVEHIPGRDRIK